ncbi:winged helix DNA-binding domain-containing protein [Actinoplanes oblitus]|uniref:Winged helix DNA-binding domain-containing protein n=1 Tax=Actinoplanes oblitus TaxID=3040509 RepID=A0ABY8WKC9_9ACTN|nr:winged helix DNA-binding domain-containing protein [Actinoplanes oblitus]WIM97927.1 winged helix DNA-binding domain-containing protein [Actinoplanes oblitus]
MQLDDVLRWRVHRHHLGSVKATDPVALARRLCGIHAQVASCAQAAADLRMDTPPDLDAALYRDRTLVRTWAARGTLHLLPAADLPYWVAAMSTRERETKGSWLKYHGVTVDQMADIISAVPDVLGGEPMTREELAAAIIAATGHEELREPLTQGFGAILKPLAFRGLLCSGPPRGRNVTFVAPREWLGEQEPVDLEEAVDRLALDYLGAYGPAEPAEFARWFDLRPPLAKQAFQRVRAEISDAAAEDTVHLLPAFDPYTVGALRQLEAISSGPRSAVSRPQGWISPVVLVNGRIEGTWDTGTITLFRDQPGWVRNALADLGRLAP